MRIVSKKEANDILVNSLFNPVNGKTLREGKFCTGKYTWTGSQKYYIGKEVVDIPGVHAVYVVRRQDSDGPYAQMRSIHEAR